MINVYDARDMMNAERKRRADADMDYVNAAITKAARDGKSSCFIYAEELNFLFIEECKKILEGQGFYVQFQKNNNILFVSWA